MRFSSIPCYSAALLLVAGTSFAQAPPPPAPPAKATTGNVSFGLALTSGNKDTSTFNASYEVVHDPKTRNIIKSSGLFLRGVSDGDLTAEQYALVGRDEYAFGKRTFVFGELRYLHDRFKEISYLIAPTGGIGYRFVETPATLLSASAGVGGVWEKNPNVDVHASGAVSADEKLSHKLSPTATITQAVTALWKTDDFADALYTFSAGIAVTIVTKAQLKAEFLDTYKNKPPNPDLKKNDLAIVMGIVYKF
ncbi:MAG: YdiY family protein [Bacteroidales bacterium]